MKIFQRHVGTWMRACFGAEIPRDREERNWRFLEEALELVQAAGMPREHIGQLVDYVYGRPVGELQQEVGGVMVTLSAFCDAHDLDLAHAADTELRRVWMNIDRIRVKQAAKTLRSPLPGPS